MKYSQFRIALLTCILGIVSVPFFNGLYDKWSEPWVDLPQVMSDTPIIVILPTDKKPFNMAGGSACGGREKVKSRGRKADINKKPLSR